MAENKVKYGLKNVCYAMITETVSTSGTVTTTYGDVKAIAGAVSRTHYHKGGIPHTEDLLACGWMICRCSIRKKKSPRRWRKYYGRKFNSWRTSLCVYTDIYECESDFGR